jgi:dolichyl-phosphate beta-glucosyltransferase
MPNARLSVVLPVFNEESVLERTFAALVPHLAGLGGSFEIVCVDDGSADRSVDLLLAAAARDPRIRVERHAANRGKGAAVRTGVLATRGERVLFMDADLSTPLEEIARFLAALEQGADCVLGNRRVDGARITRRQPKLRELLGKGFTLLTRTLLAPGISDFTCGFKAYRGQAAREIFRRSALDGWAFDAELVVIANGLGYRTVQLPVRWRHEDDSKVRVGRAVLVSLFDLARIATRRALGRYR